MKLPCGHDVGYSFPAGVTILFHSSLMQLPGVGCTCSAIGHSKKVPQLHLKYPQQKCIITSIIESEIESDEQGSYLDNGVYEIEDIFTVQGTIG